MIASMPTPEVIQERLRRLDRLAALVYAVATADLVMCPPWAELTDEQKKGWRDHVIRAINGSHEYFKYHRPE